MKKGKWQKPVEWESRELSISTQAQLDRKSTRLNSSHLVISYAVFCLKKKRANYRNCPATSLLVFPLIDYYHAKVPLPQLDCTSQSLADTRANSTHPSGPHTR